jgi:hypothetical protein
MVDTSPRCAQTGARWVDDANMGERFYFSPAPQKYYRELTNGTIETAAKIYEVGVGYFYNFGR